MRLKGMLQTTVILGLAVVAGLLGASGTWALWNVAAPAQAGAVQSATFDVKLKGGGASSTGAMRLDSPPGKLTPTAPVYTTFTVTNESDAGGDFRLQVVPQTLGIESANRELARHLSIHYALVPASGGCAAAAYKDALIAEVGKNALTRFCVRMSLPEKAPESVSGSTATVTTQVTATQIPPATHN